MSQARRRFPVGTPDWGEGHLTTEAVAAFVDGELTAGPAERAARHVDRCAECAGEVVAQRQARAALRAAAGPRPPSGLLSSLRAIPLDAELPGPPPGLAVAPDGTLVTMVRPETGEPRRRPGPSLRVRLGAGAAVSGLALGALAFAGAFDAAPAPGRDVFRGTGPGPGSGLEARLGGRPTGQPGMLDAGLRERLDAVPGTMRAVRGY